MGQVLKITDYTTLPGTRYEREGPYSGERFRDEVVWPAFLEAEAAGVRLTVDLAGAVGFGTSFLEETFGGLCELAGLDADRVFRTLSIKCDDDPAIVPDCEQYIRDAVLDRQHRPLSSSH